MTIKEEYQASLKSMDTEEWLDLRFYRPLGFMWAKFFQRLHVSPNVVTIASIFLGIAGGVLLYFRQPGLIWLNYLGFFLIIWANTYDSADGQLARLTKQYSRIGRILDGLSGDLWFLAIYFALTLREIHFGDAWPGDWFSTHSWVIWILAWTAGLHHASQASMADYYRQFHLFFVNGKKGSELESSEQLREQAKSLTWGNDFWGRLTMPFYINYTRQQESNTPNMQRLRAALKQKYGDDTVPQEFAEWFRAQSLPLMKYTNILSFNTRIIAMFISVIIDMPWLYFAFEIIVLNVLLIYMNRTHERICAQALQLLTPIS